MTREDKKKATDSFRSGAVTEDNKGKFERKPNPKKRGSDMTVEGLDELHMQQMKEIAERRDEKYQIRLRELELAEKKQEFEKKRYEGKVWKMEVEAEKEKRRDEREKRQAEQFAQMMSMMFARHGGQSSQPTMNFSQTFNQPDASTSTSTFTNGWLPPNSAGMNLGNDDTGMFDDLQGFTSNEHTDNFKFD